MSLLSREVRDEDDGLIQAVLRGEPRAFPKLLGRYRRLVNGIALAYAPPCDVDDLVQEVFVSVIRNLRQLRNRRKFSCWLATLTRNCCIDYRRRLAHRLAQTLPPDIPQNRLPTTDAMIVLDAINELPDVHREILLLRYVEGYTGPEIARHLGMTHGSTRNRLCEARKLLSEKLGMDTSA